jgi:hypothetical protein
VCAYSDMYNSNLPNIQHPSSTNNTTTMNDISTSSKENVYNGFRDFGGPDPQIKIITSDNHAFMVSIKLLTDAS